MSDNVVGLHGKWEAPRARVSAELVGELERLLAAAKAGEIIGLAGGYVHKNQTVSYSFAGRVGFYGLIGGLACLQQRLVRLMTARD